jgi:16S rRNA (cytidine1402-2'-O)-methyltransferase
VGTPIGNLEDITLRALRVLREADVIACEDTRQTQKLLTHYDIHKRTVSYHQHNEMTRAPELVIEMEEGAKVALVSDAGMPVISDPGHHLIALCVRHRIPVVPVPGATALVAALAASGMPTAEFLFAGFLPARMGQRRKALEDLRGQRCTLVLYEAPHRIVEMLQDAAAVLGERPAVVAREVTKLHEEFARGTLSELVQRFREREPRGEMTVLIGAPRDDAGKGAASAVPLARRVEEIACAQGVDSKTALKQAARERGISKREAYKEWLAGKKG